MFDWDGTIVDTLPLIYRANVVVLGELGITLSHEWFRERYTPDWRAAYRELGVPEDRWEAVAARWSEEMLAGRPRAIPWVARRAAPARPERRAARPRSPRRRATSWSPTSAASTSRACSRRRTTRTTSRPASPTPRRCSARSPTSRWSPRDAVYVGDTTVDLAMAIGRRDAVRRGRRHDPASRCSAPRASSGSGPTSARGPTTSWALGPRERRPTVRPASAALEPRVAVGGDVDDGIERSVRSQRRGRRSSAASMPGSSAARGRPATNTQ